MHSTSYRVTLFPPCIQARRDKNRPKNKRRSTCLPGLALGGRWRCVSAILNWGLRLVPSLISRNFRLGQ